MKFKIPFFTLLAIVVFLSPAFSTDYNKDHYNQKFAHEYYQLGTRALQNQKYSDAHKNFKQSAYYGNTHAMLTVSNAYLMGTHTKKDILKALIYSLNALEDHNPEAQKLVETVTLELFKVFLDPIAGTRFVLKCSPKYYALLHQFKSFMNVHLGINPIFYVDEEMGEVFNLNVPELLQGFKERLDGHETSNSALELKGAYDILIGFEKKAIEFCEIFEKAKIDGFMVNIVTPNEQLENAILSAPKDDKSSFMALSNRSGIQYITFGEKNVQALNRVLAFLKAYDFTGELLKAKRAFYKIQDSFQTHGAAQLLISKTVMLDEIAENPSLRESKIKDFQGESLKYAGEISGAFTPILQALEKDEKNLKDVGLLFTTFLTPNGLAQRNFAFMKTYGHLFNN